MPQFSYEKAPYICRAIIDEDAPLAVDQLAAGLRSQLFNDIVMREHPRGNEMVRMRDHVNVVFTLEFPPNKLVGLVLAELEHDNHLARLHLIYILRSYRSAGHAVHLLEEFEDTISQSGYAKVLVAAMNHRSLKLLQDRKSSSRLEYEIVVPDEDVLRRGDEELLRD